MAWDHNKNLSETDKVLGGLISSVNDVLGTNMGMSYLQPGIIFAAGVAIAIIGWLALARIK